MVHNSCVCFLLLLLPLALQPAVGFGLSNNSFPFSPIYHQLSPSSHSQHLKISSYFFSPSIPGSSSSSRPFQFLSEDLFGNYCKYFCNHGIYLEFQGIYRVATCLSFACHKAVCCNWWETNCPEKTLQLLHLREVYKLHRVSGT